MKAFLSKFPLGHKRLPAGGDHEHPGRFETPFPPAVGIALLGCLVSLMLVYWIARPLLERHAVWWAEWLVYAFVPVAVTFITLYRSNWHREMTRTRRPWFLLLISGVIFGGLLLAVAGFLAVAWFCSISGPKMGGR